MFHPSEVELADDDASGSSPTSSGCKPTRVVFDSLSELRLLAGNRAALPPADPGAQAVLRRRASARCMLLDDMTATDHDLQVQSIAHGVVLLEQLQSGVRLRAPPAAGGQVSRREVPRRLSRLRRSSAAGSRSSRGWSRPSTGSTSDARASWRAASPSSTRCSAAASKRARAR